MVTGFYVMRFFIRYTLVYTVNQSATCLWLFFAQIEVASQSYPDHRILFLVDCMGTAAAALIGGKQGVPPHPYNERVKRGIRIFTVCGSARREPLQK